MSYLALARKYRPETFAEVVGQSHVTSTLRAAVRKDKLSHAYVFAGPRGCGKTTVARLLAKALNCGDRNDGDPCGVCDNCRAIARGSYLDVLEIDAASHTGVDNVRELRDMAQYRPAKGLCRVFIIDEVHMLSKGAFNALLKILEEPPANVFFFFATTEPNKIPRTILSRCQRFDFRLLSEQELTSRLGEVAASEKFELTATGLRMLVSLAEGSMRDGLSLLDQVGASCDGEIDEAAIVDLLGLVRSELFSELNEAIIAHDSAQALRLVDGLVASGQSLDAFAEGVVTNFRNLLLLKIDPELVSAVALPPERVEVLTQQATRFTEQDLLALIERASWHFDRIHRSGQPRIMMEAAVVEYARFESRVLLSDLARRLGDLIRSAGGGGGPGDGQATLRSTAEAAGDGVGRADPGGQARAGARGGTTEAGSRAPAAGAQPAQPSRTARPAAASAAETVEGWMALVQSLMQSHPRLASCLMEGLPSLDEERSRLVIAYSPDKTFQMRSLSGDCGVIEERVAALWGKRWRVELAIGMSGPAETQTENLRREVAPTDREVLDKACREDRVLNDLVTLMQGEPLAESERDRWPTDPTDEET